MAIRKIIHVDMDCFYAAVETKYRPEFRGKALGIGGPPNSRSVLCTANYEARKFKVRAAMPSSLAVKLCPNLILVPPNFELYKKESLAIREIFSRFTNLIEPLSLDEAYLDVSNSSHFNGSATLIAKEIRALIKKETALTASAGVAPNKFLAKVACDWKKPDGLFVIRPEDIDVFVKPLKVEKIFGVGKVTAKKMHDLGLNTCADLQKHSLHQLTQWFGSRGAELLELAHGIDHREVRSRSERKSLTVETTFASDISKLGICIAEIPKLYSDWENRMLKVKAKSIIKGFLVKLKYFDFKSTTHEISSSRWPSEKDFEKLVQKVWDRRGAPVRLLGLGVRLADTSSADQSDQSDQTTPQLSFAI